MDFSAVKELEIKLGLKSVKQNLCFTHGQSNTLFDTNDKPYLDLVCAHGENCLGYSHPRLTEAVTTQASRLISVSDEYYSEKSGAVLSKLLSGTGFTKAGIVGNPLEALNTAFNLALIHLKDNGDDRSRIVIASGDETLLSIHRDDDDGEAVRYVEFNNFEALKKALTPDTAMLAIEPVTNSTLKFADYDYLVNAYALCKSMDIILLCDETQIGVGRTGKKFAFEAYGVQPDIVSISRGLAGGLPIGAVLTRDSLAAGFKPQLYRHSTSANLLSLAAAEVVLDGLESGLLEDISARGEYLLSKLYKLTKYNFVLDIRGRGLLAGIELSGRIMAAKVVSQMEKLGFLFSYTEGNILRLSPAFTVTNAEIDSAVDALTELFAATNI